MYVLIVCLIVLQSGVGIHSQLQADTHFSEVGTIVAPMGYEDVRIDVIWDAIIHSTRELLGETKTRYANWSAVMQENRVDDVEVKKRLTDVGVTLQPLWAAAYNKLDAFEDATLGTGLGDRKERGAFGVVAGILGLGSSLYTSKEVKDMEKQIVVHQHEIEISRHLILDFKKAVTAWTIEVKDAYMEETYLGELRHAIISITQHLQLLTDAVMAAGQNRLHRGILRLSQANTLLLNVTDSAARRGLVTLDRGLDVMFASPVSHIFRSDRLTVWIHVPIVPAGDKSMKKLLRARPAVVQRNGTELALVPKKQFLAIDVLDDEFVAMDSPDLESCRPFGRTRFCPALRRFHRKPQSCVACLYFKQQKCAVKRCSLAWSLVDEEAQQIDEETFYVTESVVVTCTGQRTVTDAKGYVNVPKGCSALSPSIHVTPVIGRSEITVTMMDNFTIDLHHLGLQDADYFAQVGDTLAKIVIPPVHPLPPKVANLWTVVKWVVIVGTIVAALIAVAVICVVCYLKFAKGEDVPAQVLAACQAWQATASTRADPRPRPTPRRVTEESETSEEQSRLNALRS